MKTLAIAMGTLLTTVAATASAQVYIERVDPYYGRYTSSHECWNPRAGHFEQVRPGEYQGDLDFGRCRMIGDRWADRGTYYDNRYEQRGYGVAREECWNPRARHFEEVRRGEIQNDLDYTRCRIYR
jgi:hypothetical protein